MYQSVMGIWAFLLYVKLICCIGFPQIFMLDWRRRLESVCHGYMCILLYVKVIWCGGFVEINICQIGGECVVSLSWVYVHSSICETYLLYCIFHISCIAFP